MTMAQTTVNPYVLLSAARIIVRRRVPYFTGLLTALVPVEKEGLGTIAVSANAILYYDPAAIAKWSPKQLAGSLLHEVCHLWLKHFQRCGKRDHRIYNMAGDLAINPSVIETGLELPPNCLMPQQFGWKNGETADEYYRLMQETIEHAKAHGDAKCKKCAPNALIEVPGFGSGKCGTCGGHGHDFEPKDGQPGPDGETGRTKGQLDRLAKQTAESMKEHAAKNAGTVPGGWLKTAELYSAPAKVPWRQKLAHALRAACAYRPGATVHRFDGPSRRQAGLGFGVGKPVLPRLRTPMPKCTMALDTSGSMGAKETSEALIEARGILQAIGSDITFIACDSQVHSVQNIRRVEDAIPLIKGGGGTSMTPIFEHLKKSGEVPDCLIIATDGFLSDNFSSPVPPIDSKIIWLYIGAAVNNPCAAFGEHILVEPDDKRTTESEDV